MSEVISPSQSPALLDCQSVSEAVVRAVADAKGVSPLDVNPPLASVIDPDALENVVASMDDPASESANRVEFVYSGYTVTVTDDDVSVARPGAE